MFNVSRIPVREALARLEALGLVTNQRYKGAVVASLSLDEIAETFEFRALIEPEVLRLAAANMRRESLEEAGRQREVFAVETNPERWAQLNRAFHCALYRDANRPYHLQVVSSALDKVGRYLKAQLALTDGMEQARREHDAILDACLSGDGNRAAALTRAHILDASHSLIAFLRRERGEQACF